MTQILLETAELPKLTKSTIASGIPHLGTHALVGCTARPTLDEHSEYRAVLGTHALVGCTDTVGLADKSSISKKLNNVTPDIIQHLISEGRDMPLAPLRSWGAQNGRIPTNGTNWFHSLHPCARGVHPCAAVFCCGVGAVRLVQCPGGESCNL